MLNEDAADISGGQKQRLALAVNLTATKRIYIFDEATGNIDADPYLRSGNRSYCDFCDYADACFFEEGSGRDCHRYLYPVKGQRFWESAGADENEERGQQNGG